MGVSFFSLIIIKRLLYLVSDYGDNNSSVTPFVPSDSALEQSQLTNKTVELNKKFSLLMEQLYPLTLSTLEKYMRVINSYYSNLIEGNTTHPREILAAQRGDYSDDVTKRDVTCSKSL